VLNAAAAESRTASLRMGTSWWDGAMISDP
jgi:hypothetical protein